MPSITNEAAEDLEHKAGDSVAAIESLSFSGAQSRLAR